MNLPYGRNVVKIVDPIKIRDKFKQRKKKKPQDKQDKQNKFKKIFLET